MLYAQQVHQVVEVQRIPSEESINKYRQNPAFDYAEKAHGPTLWERILRAIIRFFRIKPDSYAETFLTRDIWYILFVIVLAATIYTFFKSEIHGLFYKSPSATVEMHVLEEDIHSLNFDTQINDAVQKKNFRYAIRLYYLQNLKELNDRGLISWKGHKTNYDYLQELNGKPLFNSFSGITQLFNWIWYGDFSLSEEEFGQFKTEFIQFSNQLKTRA